MNINEILEIMNTFDQSNINKMKFQKGELNISLEKDSYDSKPSVVKKEKIIVDTPIIEESPVTGHEVVSPIVGIYYEAPAPDQSAFVSIGDTVTKGQVLCIVEAMKVMNEIVADRPGKVIDIKANNGDLVEYGQPLFVLE